MARILRTRRATQEDIDEIVRINYEAFKDNVTANARWLPEGPENPNAREVRLKWRADKYRKVWDKPGRHIIVVTEHQPGDSGDGIIIGCSEWQAPPEVLGPVKTPEQEDEEFEQQLASWPSIVDKAGVREVEMSNRELTRVTQAALGDVREDSMWSLFSITVDPQHHRKGAGQTLVKWGMEQAKADKKPILLYSAPAGKPLYDALGFTEIARVEIRGTVQTAMLWKPPVEEE